MTCLSDYVYKETIFSSDFCDNAIGTLDSNKWEPHVWYGSGDHRFHDRKDFMTSYNTDLMFQMKDAIISCVQRYEKKYMEVSQFCGVRFNKYSVGQGIKQHVDHIHSLFDGERKGIPIISIVGTFNDDYEGGEFVINDEVIDMKQGDMLVFPSCFLYPHMVKPVTKGIRYSWVLWGY